MNVVHLPILDEVGLSEIGICLDLDMLVLYKMEEERRNINMETQGEAAEPDDTIDKGTLRICKFFGDISYPVYIVHYPFMYLFYAWVWNNDLTFGQVWPVALLLFFGNILLAYLCLKLYDEPIRKWLSKKFLSKK